MNEKQETLKVLIKLFLEVSIYLPFNSFLFENAAACITKSIEDHFFEILSKHFSIEFSFAKSHSIKRSQFNVSTRGLTLFSKLSF